MFQPPRCPWRACPRHAAPLPRFYRVHGSYVAKCRPRPIPRFRCKTCGRTFSRQTFRMDYGDHRPDLNAELFLSLACGVGLRQSSRTLGLSRRCTELKARKIGRHLRRLDLNLRGPLPRGATLHLDELETYEGRRNTRPLTVPVLIETKSRFVIWAESATIPPSGRMSDRRKALIRAEALRFGRRRDNSRGAVRRTLRRGASLVRHLDRVVLFSDEKATYPGLAAAELGAERLVHLRTNSRVPRTERNPLFPINSTEALARDLMGRLRRESWLVSKKRRYLDIALHVFIAYRNYVRRRFNRDGFSSAEMLGFVPRRMRAEELLSWRQDGGLASLHPLGRRGESVAQWNARRGCG
jgi:transposase-like protein